MQHAGSFYSHMLQTVEDNPIQLPAAALYCLNRTAKPQLLCGVVMNAADETEWKARNAANIKWLQTAFQVAKSEGSLAIMIISQVC